VERAAQDRRPIFHVGVHKTATNWFQKCFYPRVPGYRYVDRRLVRSTLLAHSPLAFEPERVREELGLDADCPAIICEEDLSGVLHNAGLASNYIAKEMANELAALAPQAQIVIFVRNQQAMAASCYHQYLREGGTGSVHRYLFPEDYIHLGNVRPLKNPRFDFTQFEFDRLVAHYDSLFGEENVHVFAYEQFAQDPEAFLAMFAEDLGLTRPESVKQRKYNRSFRRALVPVARMLNLLTRRSVADKRTLVHIPFWYPVRTVLLEGLNFVPLLGKRPSPRDLLGGSIYDWIGQRFWESNRALEGRMGVDLSEWGYTTEEPAVPVPRPKRSSLFAFAKH